MSAHRRISLALCFSSAAALLVPSLLLASSGGGHEMTLSDILWDLGIKTLNVSILGFLAFKYLSGPLNRYVDSRAAQVRRELEEATAARRDAEERLRQFKLKIAGIDAELEALKKQTCEDIDREQKILLDEAREAAGHIRQHALDTIRQEMIKARTELHREAVRLAAGLAEETVRSSIDSADHRRLVDGYLREMEAKK